MPLIARPVTTGDLVIHQIRDFPQFGDIPVALFVLSLAHFEKHSSTGASSVRLFDEHDYYEQPPPSPIL